MYIIRFVTYHFLTEFILITENEVMLWQVNKNPQHRFQYIQAWQKSKTFLISSHCHFNLKDCLILNPSYEQENALFYLNSWLVITVLCVMFINTHWRYTKTQLDRWVPLSSEVSSYCTVLWTVILGQISDAGTFTTWHSCYIHVACNMCITNVYIGCLQTNCSPILLSG